MKKTEYLEKLFGIYMRRNMNWGKYKEEQRILMNERRRNGLTQKAQKKYVAKNKLSIAMYGDLIKIEPKLRRKGYRACNASR